MFCPPFRFPPGLPGNAAGDLAPAMAACACAPNRGALHRSDPSFRLWSHVPGVVRLGDAAVCGRIHADVLGALQARLQVWVWGFRDLAFEAHALAGLHTAKAQQPTLLAAKNAAAQANIAKPAFVDHMAHALCTPLHALLGFATPLHGGAPPPLPAPQRAPIGEPLRAGQNLLGVIGGLFALARSGRETTASLPAAPPPAPPPPSTTPVPQTAAIPAASAAAQPLRVLYIDDNPVNTLLMTAMFERLPGLQLRCECDPCLGLALALTDPPALLLVDIQMPGLDGYQLLAHVRADPVASHVPAIAVSANAMPEDLVRGLAAGFVDYLTKPLDLQRLQAALQAVLPGWSAPPP